MTNYGSDASNTPDFAFEPPTMGDSANTTDSFDSFVPNSIKTPTYGTPLNQTVSPTGFSSHTMGYPSNANLYHHMGSFSNSSFSTASGSSFSTTDNLPAISRDFVRPSSSETRRPATAGGALQSGANPFKMPNSVGTARFHRSSDGAAPGMDSLAESDNLFSNPDPFASPDEALSGTPMFKQPPSHTDLTLSNQSGHPNDKRANESQFPSLNAQMPWGSSSNSNSTPEQDSNGNSPHSAYPLASAPPHVVNFGGFFSSNPHSQNQQLQRGNNSVGFTGRPQTSDGLPSYGHLQQSSGGAGVPLPSARTIVDQIDPSTIASGYPFSNPALGLGTRDNRSASLGEIHPGPNAFPGRHYSMSGLDKFQPPKEEKEEQSPSDMTFVTLGGPTPKKRPRRRFDEIERLYSCGWMGCEKSYGTLNHLNAHVAMQKHGEKRLPSEFKDMRKQWRKRKREQAAAAANSQFTTGGTNNAQWGRPSIGSSSDSDFDARRDSNASAFSSNSEYSRTSLVYAPGYSWNGPAGPGGPSSSGDGSRPNTSSSIASSADGRFPLASSTTYQMGPVPLRRPSVPGHLQMSPAHPQNGQMGHPAHVFPPSFGSMANDRSRPNSSTGVSGMHFQPMSMSVGSGQIYGGASQFAFQR